MCEFAPDSFFCRLSQAHTPLKTTHWNEWECSSCVEDIAAPLITTFPCALLFSAATSSHDSQQQPAYTLPRPHTQRHLHYQTPTTALPLYCGSVLMFRRSSELSFLLSSPCLWLQEGWGRGEHEGVTGFKSPHFTDPNTTDTWWLVPLWFHKG